MWHFKAAPRLSICLILTAVTWAVFWQVRTHEFIAYDDPYYVSGNHYVQQGVTREGLVWAFARVTGIGTYWHPVTWISHMLDCQLFGVNPGAHHLVSVMFHAVNAVLLFLLLNKLTAAFWPSAVVAALFAWHPFQVDSVAWLAERKNLVSTLFLILTVFAYAKYVESSRCKVSAARQGVPARRRQGSRFQAGLWYVTALFLFALGLMSKPMLVTLPCVLLLLDFWPLRRTRFHIVQPADTSLHYPATPSLRLLLEKIPFLALSAVSSLITIAAHRQLDLVISADEFSWSERISHAVVGYGLYLWKTIWPSGMAVYYPRPLAWHPWQVLVAGGVLVSVSLVAVRGIKQRPWLAVGWLWFLGTLVPVIGLVQVNDQAMADRFAYVPIIGLFLIAAWGGAELIARLRWRPRAVLTMAGVILLAYAGAAWAQTRHWKDTETLFTHALNVTTGNYVAHNSLGRELMERGEVEEAMRHFEAVLDLKYYTAVAHNNIGVVKAMRGDIDGAMRCFRVALISDPRDADAHTNMGLALVHKRRFGEATGHLSEAVRLRPQHVEAHNNLALAFRELGHLAEAEHHCREAIRLKPDFAKAHLNLGTLLTRQGRVEEARLHLNEALRHQPGFVEAERQLALLPALKPDAP